MWNDIDKAGLNCMDIKETMKSTSAQCWVTSERTGMAWFAARERAAGRTVRGTHVSGEEEESLLRFGQIQVYLVWHIATVSLPNPGGKATTVLVSHIELFTMYKSVQKKNHWTSRVNECTVSKDANGDLNVPLRGGAENGEFAYIGQPNEDVVLYKSGKLNEGELLLEVENLSISGLPLYDIQTVIKNCRGPVRLKTVRQGKDW